MEVVQGNLRVGRYRGVPLLFHWSLPLGLIFLTRFRWVPGAWLGFVLLVVVHESGHALLVRRYRMLVTGIQLHGLGGECRYAGAPTEWQTAAISWGGVLGQALLLPIGLILSNVQVGEFASQFGWALTWMNLNMIALNLLPIGGFDGAEAWKLPRMWWERRQLAKRRRKADELRHTQRVEKAMEQLEKVDHQEDMPLPKDVQDVLEKAMRRAREEDEPDD